MKKQSQQACVVPGTSPKGPKRPGPPGDLQGTLRGPTQKLMI